MEAADPPEARVLVSNGYPILRAKVLEIIETSEGLRLAGWVDDGGRLLEAIGRDEPSLLLLDISADPAGCLEVVPRIHERFPALKILLSSFRDYPTVIARALQRGACGHVSWREGPAELVETIHKTLDGDTRLVASIAGRLLEQTMAADHDGRQSIGNFSDRELAVFELIGQGLTCRQIAARLDISPRTVESHRKKLKTKLKLGNSIQLTRLAVQWVCFGHAGDDQNGSAGV